MIFRRRDPAEERRKRNKDIAKSAGKGALIGAGAGAGVGFSHIRKQRIWNREQSLEQARKRARLSAHTLKTEKDYKALHPSSYRTDERIRRAKSELKSSSKAVRAARALQKKPLKMFGKANRKRTLKAMGIAAGVAGIAGAAGAAHKKYKEYRTADENKKRYGVLAPKIIPPRQKRGSLVKSAVKGSVIGAGAGVGLNALSKKYLGYNPHVAGRTAAIGLSGALAYRGAAKIKDMGEKRRYQKKMQSLSPAQRAKERVKAKLRSAIYR